MSSVIYLLNGNDNTLILDTRASFLQSFKATNWTDLRLSMMLSVTKQSDPNDPTGLVESIGAGEDVNQVYIGFKTSDGNLPPSTNFFGFSSQVSPPDSAANQLQDAAGSPGWYTYFHTAPRSLYVSNGITKTALGGNSGPRFLDQINASYATLVVLQMTRLDPTLPVVNTLNCAFLAGISQDAGFFPATDINTIRNATRAATYLNCFGPFTFGVIPDAMYLYWPYNNSRLRIHSYVLEKYA